MPSYRVGAPINALHERPQALLRILLVHSHPLWIESFASSN